MASSEIEYFFDDRVEFLPVLSLKAQRANLIPGFPSVGEGIQSYVYRNVGRNAACLAAIRHPYERAE